jgi:hypothetical protein
MEGLTGDELDPLGHGVHLILPVTAVVFAGHLVQEVAPASLKVPAAHS